MRQIHLQKSSSKHRFSHGGSLRNSREGRRERPLSTREPVHLVLKANREAIAGGFRTVRRYRLAHQILARYSRRFFIKIEQVSFQFDHIHIIARISRRSNFQNFLRVFAGQVSQRFTAEGLATSIQRSEMKSGEKRSVTDTPWGRRVGRFWKHRPFTRVIRGFRAFITARNYVQLNEQEAQGKIPYRKQRLRGLSADEWERLWG